MLIRIALLALLLSGVAAEGRAAEAAQLTLPTPGTILHPAEVRFAWTAVVGASAYYVYVGSGVGQSDLANSGELSGTDFIASSLPGAVALYVRLWTHANGAWTFIDYSFQTSGASRLTLPIPDSSGFIPPTAEFRWTSVSNAVAYYLYVGTSPGAKDVIDSGETVALSRHVDNLPEGERIFVRLWTKVLGHWYFNDYHFDVSLLRAKLITPVPSTLSADPRQTFVWSTVPGAQAYYLYVGTTRGAKDAIDSGELLVTQRTGPVLDGATQYYVRLYTKRDEVWRYRDYEFRTAPIARVIAPAMPAAGVIPGREFSWSRVRDAAAYYLYVGTAPGRQDLVNTGELAGTSFRPGWLPGGETLYARLWTKHSGQWRFVDESFTTAPVPSFITPRMGAIGVGPNLTLRWSSVRNADAYRLELGTTPHGSELFDSGVVASTELGPIQLPELPVVYGRVWARSGGVWRQGSVVFATARAVTAAKFTHPLNLGTYSAGEGFRWHGNPLARHYRLLIGTAPGMGDVHDSGPIRSLRRFADDLVPGATYYATLVTSYLSGATETSSIRFTGASSQRTFGAKFQVVATAASDVTSMASSNMPVAGSVLETVARLQNRYRANCVDYATALLALLVDMNVGVSARYAHGSLVPNGFDRHTLVEVLDATDGRWLLVDPTFGVVPRIHGQPVTSAEMSAHTRSRDWSGVSYEYLHPSSEALLRGYYIDYPLLFVNIHDAATGIPYEPVPSVIDLYEVAEETVASSPHGLAARCGGGSDVASVLTGGLVVDMDCNGPDRQTFILGVPQLELADPLGQSTELLTLRRYVFD